MKLLRVGELGSEIVAALDGNNVIRDLSEHIKDLNPQTINEETLSTLKRIKLSELKEINSNGTTIVLTTHYLEEAEQLCKKIAIIDEGKIIENTSMKDLLSKLDSETFILDLVQGIDSIPDSKFSDISIRLIDQMSIEVTLSAGRNINEVFSELDRNGIKVASMRNKTNRLEQLFISRIEESATI